MSILRLWRYALMLVISCLSLNAMAAPQLVTSGSGDTLTLMGVRNIMVNDVAYNVSFAHGDCWDFRGQDCSTLNNMPFARNESLMLKAEAALSSAVFGSGNQFSHQPLRINGCSAADECNLETMFDKAFSCQCYPVNAYLTVFADPTRADQSYATVISQGTSGYPNFTYANWSAVPVPEPTSWAMYSIGMIALGGMARRRRTGKKTS
ncbi:PEP-CTERM sorting domain-containing protein [Rugamonas aquatica]|uniref:PEP-CTERM sorting domain-containing protein n=1 Tax=Rugamonas aquatica TaxID=2743357 RepID=A0A6A7N582_9BURK|nr:PEP-CTERM sorting domain-containing protein [Rugamonas aquatica]MQA40170.1 PEP-CTERM sorting domain-containing protein [Rugamonas aquatica]